MAEDKTTTPCRDRESLALGIKAAIVDRLYARRDELTELETDDAGGAIFRLYQIPLFICLGNHEANTPGSHDCINHWTDELTHGIIGGELSVRNAASRLRYRSVDQITPDGTVSEPELVQWALDYHDVHLKREPTWIEEIGALLRLLSAMPDRPDNPKPDRPVMRDNTLIKVIAAMLSMWPGGRSKWPSGKELEESAQRSGITVSDDSIRKAIALADDEMVAARS